MPRLLRVAGVGVGLAMIAGPALPPPAWAQAARGRKAAAGARVETEIEEITVTAQKREESIQETPISVTALTGEALESKGVGNVVDLAASVPNMRITSSPGSGSTTTIAIRGLVQANIDPSFSPKVGLYVDGVYIAGLKGSNVDLEDLERVEVLRGPQGTLYGKNTIGGAVNFITNKPNEQRSITLKSEVGNFETFNSRATVNVPLVGKNGFFRSDALGIINLRATAGYKTHDGYFENSLPAGAPAQPKAGGSANWSNLNRVFNFTALRWQPRNDVTVDYAFEYHRYRNHQSAWQLTYIYPQSIADSMYKLPPPYPPLVIQNPFYPGGLRPYVQENRSDSVPSNPLFMSDLQTLHQNRDEGNHNMHSLTGAWDLGEVGSLGSVTLKSIAHYRTFTAQSDTDIDGTPQHVTDFANWLNTQTWSEELQWIGTAPRIRYVLGAYYFGEYDSYRQQQVIFGDQPLAVNNLPYRNFRKSKSYAGYGEATWTPPILSDKLSLTAGLRITQEQIHLDHFYGKAVYPTSTAAALKNVGGKAFGGIHGAGVPGVDPTADVTYQWTDAAMTYFRISRGFASGGFNPTGGISELFRSFKPESLWAFESGFKTQWLDNRLRLNADGFFSYYQDLQVSVFRSSPTLGVLSIPANADRAEIWGMEFEGAAVPFRGLEANVSYSFLAPKYTKWLDQKFDANGNPVFDPSGNPVLENVGDRRTFPFAPRNQLAVGLTYTAPPTATGVFSAHLDTMWQDKVMFIANNEGAGAQADEGWAYALVNGRLAYTGIPLQKGTLDLAVWGRNLFDRKYRTFGIDFGSQLGFAGNEYGDPRTFGVGLTYNLTAGEEAPPPPAPVTQAPSPPPPAKKKIVLRSVHFDFDKATLKADAKPILDEAVQVLKREGGVDIVVEGHTDSVGTDAYNLSLSRRRAETVRTYLVDRGIARSRITAEGLGESKPVASNETADGRAQNRRVELHVT
ncbi:MAG: OmpA family protein [Candidatus Binatia bacterium]